jgi:predicted AlkP superfamily pyrophosphatase or phosphodiesterase
LTEVHFEEDVVRPDYASSCLSNVPSTLMSLLGVENGRTKLPAAHMEGVDTTGVQNVVLFVFDGFGLNEWNRQAGKGFFPKMGRRGLVSGLTTVFPSTTSTALTTLATGLTPQEHSLIEWFLYLKETDSVIKTLPFSPMGSHGSDLLKNVDPSVLFTGEPVFARLAREGVPTRSYLPRPIANSSYSRLVHSKSEVRPYFDAPDLAIALRKGLESSSGPSLHYVYWSGIDSTEHVYGPGSEESYLEAAWVSGALEGGLTSRMDATTASRTLFVVAADHGHVYSPMTQTHWLDAYEPLVRNLARSAAGRTIPPWGAPRDVYLRIREDKLSEVHDFLLDQISGFATVLKTTDAVEAGIFGLGSPTATFLERVGNLMILPKGKGNAWYRHPGSEDMTMTGQHGGMHKDEMMIPLAFARASTLVG